MKRNLCVILGGCAALLLTLPGCGGVSTANQPAAGESSPVSSTTTASHTDDTQTVVSSTTAPSVAASVSSTSQSHTTTSQKQEKPAMTTRKQATAASRATRSTSASPAYTPRPLNPAKLSATQEQKIKEDYMAAAKKRGAGTIIEETLKTATLDYVSISQYCGTYHDCIVMFVGFKDDAYTDTMIQEKVAGYTLSYPSGQTLDVYRKGQFFSVSEAYKRGWLTKDDVRDIQWYLG